MADEVTVRLRVRDRAVFARAMRSAADAVREVGEAGDETARDLLMTSKALDDVAEEFSEVRRDANRATRAVRGFNRAMTGFGGGITRFLRSSREAWGSWGKNVVFQFNRIQFTGRELLGYFVVLGPQLAASIGGLLTSTVALAGAASAAAIAFGALVGVPLILGAATAGLVGLAIAGFAAAADLKTAFGRDVSRTFKHFFNFIKALAAGIAKDVWPIVLEVLPMIQGSLGRIARDIGPAVVSIFRSMADAARPLIAAFEPLFGQSAAMTARWAQKATPAAVDVGQTWAESFGEVMPIIERIGNKAIGVWHRVAKFFGRILTPVMGQVENIVDTMAPTVERLFKMAGNALVPVLKWIDKMGQAAGPGLIRFFHVVGDFLSKLGGTFLKHAGPLLDATITMVKRLGEFINRVVEGFVNFGAENKKLISQRMGETFKVIGDVFSVMLEVLEELIPIGGIFFTEFIGPLVRQLRPVLPEIARAFTSLIVAVAPLIPPFVRLATSIIKILLPGLVLLVGIFVRIANIVVPPLVAALEWLADVFRPAGRIGVQAAKWLLDHWKQFANWFNQQTWMTGLIDALKTLGRWIRRVIDWTTGLLGKLDALADKLPGDFSIGDVFENIPGVGAGARVLEIVKEGLPGRAAGGPVNAFQPYLVGEAGRELFVPRVPGMVMPNNAVDGLQPLAGGQVIFEAGSVVVYESRNAQATYQAVKKAAGDAVARR